MNRERERLKGNLDLLLLSVLAAGPAHGYAIITVLRARSEGTFPALHRLEEAGQLTSDWAEADGRKRRVYGLTSRGETALAAERSEWTRFASSIQAVLGWSA
jgi:PadR family transcriptional regulator, regulatory protein PadR